MRAESVNPLNAADEFCPHPEWWHAENDTGTEIEVSEFIGGLVRLIQPEICVETGSYYGQTSVKIGEALAKNGHGKLYTLESVDGVYEIACGATRGLPVQCVLTESRKWTPPGTIDFLFLDSNDDRRLEFEHFLPWLERGSVFCLHDTNAPHHASEMFKELLYRHFDKLVGVEFHNPRGLFIARIW